MFPAAITASCGWGQRLWAQDLPAGDSSVWESGLSSTGASLWVNYLVLSSGLQRCVELLQEAELGAEVQMNWGVGQAVGWEFPFGVNTIFYGFGSCFTEVGC